MKSLAVFVTALIAVSSGMRMNSMLRKPAVVELLELASENQMNLEAEAFDHQEKPSAKPMSFIQEQMYLENEEEQKPGAKPGSFLEEAEDQKPGAKPGSFLEESEDQKPPAKPASFLEETEDQKPAAKPASFIEETEDQKPAAKPASFLEEAEEQKPGAKPGSFLEESEDQKPAAKPASFLEEEEEPKVDKFRTPGKQYPKYKLRPAKEQYQPVFLELGATEEEYAQMAQDRKDLEQYSTLNMFVSTMLDIIYRDDAPKVQHALDECTAKNESKSAEDENTISVAQNKLWMYCYKTDVSPEQRLFDVLRPIVHVHMRQLKDCHDIWGDEGLYWAMEQAYNWSKMFDQVRAKHSEQKAADAKGKTTEGKVDAVPTDPELKERLADQSQDYFGMVKGFVDVGKSIETTISAMEKPMEKFQASGQKFDDAAYQKFVAQHKDDVLQMLQASSEVADFYCRNDEAISPHYGYTLQFWKDLLDDYALAISDDKFP